MRISGVAEETQEVEIAHWKNQRVEVGEVEIQRRVPWLVLALPSSAAMMCLATLLFIAWELPWSSYASLWGIALTLGLPALAGAGVGIGMRSLKGGILATWILAGIGTTAGAVLFETPYLIGMVSAHTPAYVGHAWLGWTICLLANLSCSAVGCGIARAASEIE
ncbi:MAG: hypothetical protein AB1665_06895 [Candidatus Thermoplasmatota archaeon]